MRTTHRLAGLALALAAGTSLAACTSSVAGEATLVSSSSASASPEPVADPDPEGPAEDPVEDPVEEPAGEPAEEPAGETTPAGTGDDDLPVPGAGIPGDAGLCQAVVGWFGYAGLALISVDETGYVDPAGVVPLLEAMRDAPAGHRDASPDLLAAADEVSAATDAAIDDIGAGTDVFVAFEGLTPPVTDFADSCIAAGVSV